MPAPDEARDSGAGRLTGKRRGAWVRGLSAGSAVAPHGHPFRSLRASPGIVKLGEANVRRVYGDFSGTRLKSWYTAVQSLAILQHQQRSNTTGMNASDIALVIDAMDVMHEGTLDGFCLVSSDTDFTRLAQRLREEAMLVYGFGEQKAVKAFRNACNRFIYVENLVDASVEEGDAGDASASSANRK